MKNYIKIPQKGIIWAIVFVLVSNSFLIGVSIAAGKPWWLVSLIVFSAAIIGISLVKTISEFIE